MKMTGFGFFGCAFMLALTSDALGDDAWVLRADTGFEYAIRYFYDTFEGSQRFCVSKGGNLVSIASKEEQAWLREELLPEPNCRRDTLFVTGLVRESNESYSWLDGTPITYTNFKFDDMQPHPNWDYVVVLLENVCRYPVPEMNYYWVFGDGSQDYVSICKRLQIETYDALDFGQYQADSQFSDPYADIDLGGRWEHWRGWQDDEVTTTFPWAKPGKNNEKRDSANLSPLALNIAMGASVVLFVIMIIVTTFVAITYRRSAQTKDEESDWDSDGGNTFDPTDDYWKKNRDLNGFHYNLDLDAPLREEESHQVQEVQEATKSGLTVLFSTNNVGSNGAANDQRTSLESHVDVSLDSHTDMKLASNVNMNRVISLVLRNHVTNSLRVVQQETDNAPPGVASSVLNEEENVRFICAESFASEHTV